MAAVVEEARRDLDSAREGIAAMEERLRTLDEERARRAVAGEETGTIRQALQELRSDLEEQRMREAHLQRAYEAAAGEALHGERLEALLTIYRRDLDHLRGEREVVSLRCQHRAAVEALRRLNGGVPHSAARTQGLDTQRLGIGFQGPVLELKAWREGVVGRRPLSDVDSDIKRMEALVSETERLVSAHTTTTIGGPNG